jgi:hypothetical protein
VDTLVEEKTAEMPKRRETSMQNQHNYDYRSAYQQALQVNWQVEDIIGGEKTLDFRKPFLPEVWVDADSLDFLSDNEKLTVNHIRSHSYLYLFGFVEEYIVPFVVGHVQSRIHKAAPEELRALLHFAEEEVKHIQLFQRFCEEFRAGFGSTCEVLGSPETVAAAILSKSPLGAGLSILHIEWMTLLHYVSSVRDNVDIDPQFSSLLRHHWLEESQHAKLDTLIVEAIARQLSEREVQEGIDDYLAIGGVLDAGLGAQMEMDLASFARATGRTLSDVEAQHYREVQQRSYRKTFLTSGMRHGRFQSILAAISPEGAKKVSGVARALVPEDTN